MSLRQFKLNIPYKGVYSDSAKLIAAHTTGSVGNYAYVTGTNSYWYWNDAATILTWVNQEITEANYISLTTSEKAAVPYIVGV